MRASQGYAVNKTSSIWGLRQPIQSIESKKGGGEQSKLTPR
jgi:hypothetical protein